MKSAWDIRIIVRINDGDQRFFGPGMVSLLESVERLKSLRAAAAEMAMSYSKAWRIIKTAEESLGGKLLESRTGGSGGGGAVLTDLAKEFLSDYKRLNDDIIAYGEKRFEEIMLK